MPLHDQLYSTVAQQTGHSREHIQFAALDVDLDDIRAPVDEIVERHDLDLDDVGDGCVDALREQTVDSAHIASQKQVADLVRAPGSRLVHDNVVQCVGGDIF